MDAGILSKSASLSEGPTGDEAGRLGRGASLMLILALSLGLWAAIWAAAASLTALLTS